MSTSSHSSHPHASSHTHNLRKRTRSRSGEASAKRGRLDPEDAQEAEMEPSKQATIITRNAGFDVSSALAELPVESQMQVAMFRDLIVEKMVKGMVQEQRLRVHPSGTALTENKFANFNRRYRSDPKNELVQQSIAEVPVSYIAESRDYLKSINYVYSHTLDVDPRATNQAHSGRCWLFSGLNAMRIFLIQKFNLRSNFQLSQAHLFFYDKLERVNQLLEEMIDLRNEDENDPLIHGLLSWFSLVDDGGTWGFFTNLVKKYGVMPKSTFDECMNTLNTEDMNEVLKRKVSQFTADLRKKSSDGWSEERLRRYKDRQLVPQIYNLLRNFMGNPPTKFDWSYYETFESNARHEAKRHNTVKDLTPQQFFNRFVDPVFKIDSKVCLIHDPRKESVAYQTYIPEHFANMVGGQPNLYVNVPMKEMKHAAKKSIMDKVPCWIACDVGKCFNWDKGLLDDKAYNYTTALNNDLTLSKEDRVRYRDSIPSHAMLLVGADIDSKKNQARKWRIENSWGGAEEGGEEADPGYLQMSDSWFSEYMFEVVVDREYLSDSAREQIAELEETPVSLPFNDPFGAVALR